jgi:hypothetical protein
MLAPLVRRVSQESKVTEANKAYRAVLDHKDSLGHRANEDLKENPAVLVRRVLKVIQVQLAYKDLQEKV